MPLYDCRDAGTRALQSALMQDYPRGRYEIVAIVDARARRSWPDALLARCDRVAAVDSDFDAVESEIGLFATGARLAEGDFLYFIEGHTVLEAGALGAIDRHLTRSGDCAIACGRRTNHARTRLGRLIGGNNDAHERRARSHGNFTLGANCVIRRATFEALGGFDQRFLRFSETVLYQRALDAGVAIETIDATLCTHHNDAGFRWLMRLLVATGRAKARFYASKSAGRGGPRVRHPVYRWFGSAGVATLAAWPLRIAGPALICAAMALVRRSPMLALAIYRTGIGLTDVSGFCFERSIGRSVIAGAAERTSLPRPAA